MRDEFRRTMFLAIGLAGSLVFHSLSACAQPAAAALPTLVVFDFDSAGDQGKLGQKVAEMFRGAAGRRGAFQIPDALSFEEALGASGRKVTSRTPLAQVAAVAGGTFSADIAIWGSVKKLSDDEYLLHVYAWESVKNPTALALDREYTSTLHGLQTSIATVLDELAGTPAEAAANPLEDESWRKRTNLCRNGGFEEGTDSPAGWERVDGLSSFWARDAGTGGRCIRFDTNVLESQYTAWHKLFDQGAAASAAPVRLPTKPPYYDTIGGLVGAHLYSDPIRVVQGRTYRIDLDARGPKDAIAKCFVKGYAPFSSESGAPAPREVYRAQLNITFPPQCTRYLHFSQIFHPTQPLLMLCIRSDFDAGATGAAFRDALIREMASREVIELKEAAFVLDRIKGSEELLQADSPEADAAGVVRQRFGRGCAVWGAVTKEGASLTVSLRGMDVRKEAVTKVWRQTWTAEAGQLEQLAPRVSDAILEQARVVTFLRVKLDAYWPVGDYYFDNVWVTEEPENAGAQ